MSTEQQESKPVLFAVVELFGHAKIAGAVSEQTFGGATFVRVDVPEVKVKHTDYDAPRDAAGRYQQRERVIQAHSRSFGPGAIYSINWCDEAAAVLMAHSIQHEPIKAYSVREAMESMSRVPQLVGAEPEEP